MATDFLDGSHIVGGKNNGRSFFAQFQYFFFQEFDIDGVESAERFIKNQHFYRTTIKVFFFDVLQ